MLIILFGVVVFALYFGAANSVQQLAADAARASIAGLSDEERISIAVRRVSDSSAGYILINPLRASVSAKASDRDPNVFQVAVSYDARDLPIWAFQKLIPLPPKTITRTASIQRGGY